jgi:hypothetical protein
MSFIYGLAFYALVGLITAVAFVGLGVARVLAQPVNLTMGARLVLLPGAAALWPYVLFRWLRSGRRQ